jgi:squalene-hopene/tetraprenyl-beta-curcumene cyclase
MSRISNEEVARIAQLAGVGTLGEERGVLEALDALGEPEFNSKEGPRNWKSDLLKYLSNQQQENGSWTNPDARWMEGDPNLVTGYVLLTLSYLK